MRHFTIVFIEIQTFKIAKALIQDNILENQYNQLINETKIGNVVYIFSNEYIITKSKGLLKIYLTKVKIRQCLILRLAITIHYGCFILKRKQSLCLCIKIRFIFY